VCAEEREIYSQKARGESGEGKREIERKRVREREGGERERERERERRRGHKVRRGGKRETQ